MFTTGRYRLEGQVPNGIKVGGVFQGNVVAAKGDHLLLRDIEMNGNFASTTVGTEEKHTGGACNVLVLSGTDALVDRCEIHNAADDGIVIHGKDVQVLRSKVHGLHGCGTDGNGDGSALLDRGCFEYVP